MPPSPATITEQHLSHCFELYPAVVQRAYARQINPKTGAEKKRAEAVERDVWRYDELPEEVGGREDGGLTLQQLERLVLWKMYVCLSFWLLSFGDEGNNDEMRWACVA